MKKPQTKAEIRARLEEEVRLYLETGGSVESIAAGISGRESPGSGYSPRSFFNEPKVPRTPIPEVIAAIEARRQSMRQQSASGKRRKTTGKARQRVIYDDFGEPLRHVWEES